MIKSVALATPIYAMACFKFPDLVCNELNAALARFWWGDGVAKQRTHWIAWDKMVEKKLVGGLGFRDFSCFNLAMLMKFGWRLMGENTSLVLKAKNYRNSSFLEAKCGNNPSWAWRTLVEERKILIAGIRWRAGNGRTVRVAHDPWIP